jgi:hypothetical protein
MPKVLKRMNATEKIFTNFGKKLKKRLLMPRMKAVYLSYNLMPMQK